MIFPFRTKIRITGTLNYNSAHLNFKCMSFTWSFLFNFSWTFSATLWKNFWLRCHITPFLHLSLSVWGRELSCVWPGWVWWGEGVRWSVFAVISSVSKVLASPTSTTTTHTEKRCSPLVTPDNIWVHHERLPTILLPLPRLSHHMSAILVDWQEC